MANRRSPQTDPSEPMVYQIRIKGHLGREWTNWFDGLTITLAENGVTLLTGPVVDQAALYGLLKKVRDLGLPLLSVTCLESNQADGTARKGDTTMKRNHMLIEAAELLPKLGKANLRIYDATILFFRSEAEPTAYEQYQQGHIPGAAFFDHQQFSDPRSPYMYTLLPEAELAAQMGNIGIRDDAEIILYSASALPSATRAWWILRYAGHNNVRVLNGGLAAWQQAGGAIEQGVRRYEPTRFTCQLRAHMFVSKEEVMAASADQEVATVNTLPLESYEAAHIAGSSCVSALDLMQARAAFLPDDQLATRLQETAQAQRIITYCGGGIAATVNAMAHLMVGQGNVAVYDGSMSEWVGEGLPTAGSRPGEWAIWRQK